MTPTDDLETTLTAGRVDMSDGLRSQILSAVQTGGAAATATHHLAQMNIARFRQPMDHPDMAGFVEMLDPINHQADAEPGCIWRLTGDGSNNATSITFYDDPLLLVNMSVWTDVQALRNYVYRTEHAAMVKRRGEWADAMDARYIVLWWIPVGHTPDIAEGDARLQMLNAEGPSPQAFTFGHSFPPPTS